MNKSKAKTTKKTSRKSLQERIENESTWEAIKLASIKGVDDYSLAEQFHVTPDSIRSRRKRDQEWKSIVRYKPGRISGRPNLAQKEEIRQKTAEKVAEVYENSMESITERNSLMMADFIFRKLSESVKGDLVEAPQNWAELATATKTLRNLTGQDKGDGAQIAISLFGDYNAHTENVRDV